MNRVSDPEMLQAAEALRGQPVSIGEYALAIRPKLVLYALLGRSCAWATFPVAGFGNVRSPAWLWRH